MQNITIAVKRNSRSIIQLKENKQELENIKLQPEKQTFKALKQ